MAKFVYIPNRVISVNGVADGATIGFYETGTTTEISIYSDAEYTTPLSNPYSVASGAAVPEIYYNYVGIPRVIITDSDDNIAYDGSANMVSGVSGGSFDGYSRTQIKALAAAPGAAVLLTEANRSGVFVFRSGDYSTEVAGDTQEGVYLEADNTDASSAAWVRVYSGPANMKWFGVQGDGSTDDKPAIQAALYSGIKEFVFDEGTYNISGNVSQVGGTEVEFKRGAEVVLTQPAYVVWGISGVANKRTVARNITINCNGQKGANGLGVGGSGLGTVENIVIESPYVRNAVKEEDYTEPYNGGGSGLKIEADIENISVICPTIEDCTAGIGYQGTVASPAMGVTIVNPIIKRCMHAAEFYGLGDGAVAETSGAMGACVILGGYIEDCGLGVADYYSDTSTASVNTDTGIIMCERARWITWTGFVAYNSDSYGSVGSVVRGTGHNLHFEGSFNGACTALVNITVSKMLLPLGSGSLPAGNQSIGSRGLFSKITHVGTSEYLYQCATPAVVSTGHLGHRVIFNINTAPTSGLIDVPVARPDALIEVYNRATGEYLAPSQFNTVVSASFMNNALTGSGQLNFAIPSYFYHTTTYGSTATFQAGVVFNGSVIYLTALPTADPATAGRIFQDDNGDGTATLKISTP